MWELITIANTVCLLLLGYTWWRVAKHNFELWRRYNELAEYIDNLDPVIKSMADVYVRLGTDKSRSRAVKTASESSADREGR